MKNRQRANLESMEGRSFILGRVIIAVLFLGERASRLDLANWITAPENPLTSRALANRLWARLFGAGLSRDLADLGNQGQWSGEGEP